MIDLHIHSTYSDGEFNISELIQLANDHQVTALAKTDHNTVSGTAELVEKGNQANLTIIPAVEISTSFQWQQQPYELHILGYFVPYQHPDFLYWLTNYLNTLNEFELFYRLQFIQRHFPKVTRDNLLSCARNNEKVISGIQFVQSVLLYPEYHTILKQHNILYDENGEQQVNTYKFYRQYCEPQHAKEKEDMGKQSPIINTEEAIKLLRTFHSIPVIAHFPIRQLPITALLPLKNVGLLGIELANHIDYHRTKDERQAILSFALQENLIVTVGSDFHGRIKPHLKYGPIGHELNHDKVLKNIINLQKII